MRQLATARRVLFDDFFFVEAFFAADFFADAPFLVEDAFLVEAVFFAVVFFEAVFEVLAGAALLVFLVAAAAGSIQHRIINNAAIFRKRQTLQTI